jgi:hypothetical protein
MELKDINRFWSKVNKGDDCWEWQGNLDGQGYGKFPVKIEGKQKFLIASRVMWEFYYGEVPTKFVCHRCDNTKCVNPKHLFLGTQKENLADMVKKERDELRAGERNPNSRLTKVQIDSIRYWRKTGIPAKVLASKFDISVGYVYNICNPKQKCWTGRRKCH